MNCNPRKDPAQFEHSLVVFGTKVREARRKKRLSREEVAEHACIHPNTLGRIERGEVDVALSIFLAVCRVLKIRIGSAFTE